MDSLAPVGAPPAPIAPIEPAGVPAGGAGRAFASMLKDAIAEVVKTHQTAEAAATSFATGQSTDVASTMIAVERAAITLQLMLQVRSHLLEAYQEIQRLQV
jgi:flagellar hook-basal body complex protein FliE